MINKVDVTFHNTGEIIAFAAKKACIYEVNAPKVGNVNLMHNFTDVAVIDFLKSAGVIGEPLSNVAEYGVGKTIEEAIKATWRVVNTNTNLGIVLLLTPLALAFHHVMEDSDLLVADFLSSLHRALARVLKNLTVDDTPCVYRAIGYASPGGLGRVSDYDVADEVAPNISLQAVMSLSAQRDMIAQQYINGFSLVFDDGLKFLTQALAGKLSFLDAIAQAHLMLLATTEDTLICRKLGSEISVEAKRLAQEAVVMGGFYTEEGKRYVKKYDQWLRADGNKRNPGSTADIMAAVIFVYLLKKIYEDDI